MFTVDDDAPMHVDRSDDPMTSPQARRALRLNQSRTTAQGLTDRIYRPKHRAPSAMAPIEVTSELGRHHDAACSQCSGTCRFLRRAGWC